ncbi:MAG: alpha/beta fold hydrolase [Promethearchaeota archaeon]
MPYTELGGQKIYYNIKKAENNKAIIFIHGSASDSSCWNKQLSLVLDYNLIALDLPSHGKSDKFATLSLELYREAIKSLMKSLSLEKIILCGHSLGGAIVISYYLEYPEDVEALILVGTGAKLRVHPLIFENLKNNFQEFLNSISVGAFYRKTDKEIIKRYIDDVAKLGPEVPYADFSICDAFDELDAIKQGIIKVPTLIICGEADKLTPTKYSKFFHENISNSYLNIIKNAGHMVMMEKPNEFNQIIEDFIKNKLN